MAFLDNSGDIILDAVLTDTGRMRLARGDGSFRIAKFALGDDEINYALYDKNNTSGSAYYDLNILQTPVLEAFTNNTSFLKSKLLTIPRTNLLYLPVMLTNTTTNLKLNPASGIYAVTANNATTTAMAAVGATLPDNEWMNGVPSAAAVQAGISPIGLDQGLNTDEIPYTFTLDPDLVENQYIVEMDNRVCQLASTTGDVAPVSFIDDDNIASYFVSRGSAASGFIDQVPNQVAAAAQAQSPIAGPRGTSFRFTLKASVEIQSSDYLFTKIGAAVPAAGDGLAGSDYLNAAIRFIDTNIRITGGQTGYRLDIPVRFVKLQ
jgi:hypothetical protein